LNFPVIRGIFAPRERIRGERKLYKSSEILIEIFTSDAAIRFVDIFYDEPDICEAVKGDFFADLEKVVHTGWFK
jgi:hypothetical protein